MTTKLAGQLRHRIKRNDGRGAMIVITGCSIGQRHMKDKLSQYTEWWIVLLVCTRLGSFLTAQSLITPDEPRFPVCSAQMPYQKPN